jgi:3-dehydroquinate synthetase/MoaA/NifB/PqqE/SkfB family radical SAM enzyme/nucleoside-diphosphate-sugar epimerase/radical SAM superfamily enzyme YgiQ (UPF0313 family)/predicted NBD/HSP70 family sugar kinase/adenine/guanine phosphoribosyltransferase-like PRPP-binding protein
MAIPKGIKCIALIICVLFIFTTVAQSAPDLPRVVKTNTLSSVIQQNDTNTDMRSAFVQSFPDLPGSSTAGNNEGISEGNSKPAVEYRDEDALLRFNTLDQQMSSRGFFGVSAADRFEYVRSLTNNIDLIESSQWVSAQRKQQLLALPQVLKDSFSHIAVILMEDILESGKEPLPTVVTLDILPQSPRVLLVSSYQKKDVKIGAYLSPPQGVYKLANILRLFGINVEVYDPNFRGPEELKKKVVENKYDFIGFSVYQPDLKNDVSLANEIKALSPDSLFIAGGQAASFNKDTLFATAPFDVIVRGLGEFGLLDVVTSAQKGKDIIPQLKDIEGLYIRGAEGDVIETLLTHHYSLNSYRALSLFFDTSIVPYEEYWNYMTDILTTDKVALDKSRAVRLITSSHCPVGCSFCTSTHFLTNAVAHKPQKILKLTAEDIIDVMKNVVKHHPETRTIVFNDDDFMMDRKRIVRFVELVKKEFGADRFGFFGLGRSDKVDAELLALMRSIGFNTLSYGPEHFAQRVIDDIDKKISSEKSIEAIELTLKSGITTLFSLIPFYPNAMMDDVRYTIEVSMGLAKRGAEISYFPFVLPFKGASIIKKSYSEDEETGCLLPADPDTCRIAKNAVRNHPYVREEMCRKYSFTGRPRHIVDVLSFFLSVYREAGYPSDHIEQLIREKLEEQKQGVESLQASKADFGIEWAIEKYMFRRKVCGTKIHPDALRTIEKEATVMGTDNIDWALRSILGKTSGEDISNEEIKHFIGQGKIKTSVMLFSPKMRPGDMKHSNRLKKDVPIKAGNRPYSPVMGEALTYALTRSVRKHVDIAEVIKKCKEEGRQLVVVGKYTGGLVPGMLIADKYGLPFINLTKLPFDFTIPDVQGEVIRVKEPHLPADSDELYSYMLADPNTSVILIDDESTTGKVHTNTVKELEKMGIRTEAVIVLMQSSDEAEERIKKEAGVPYVYMKAMYTDNNWRLRRPIYLPFADLKVANDERLLYPENGEGVDNTEIGLNVYSKEDGTCFVDHALRGMTMPIDPQLAASCGMKISDYLNQTMHIQDMRKQFYKNGKTLYIVGTTPSGLYAATAASQITRIPLLGATNRPEPIGSEDTVNYVGLDGYNYSIYGVQPGDGVILVTGELTDGEEQSRIIKSLSDKGIEVLCSVSAVENEYYSGREKIENIGIGTYSINKYNLDESIPQTNISSKVRDSFIHAMEELSRTIKTIDPHAEIEKIVGLPSSFTRGLMINDSDLDEVYVYVTGVSQVQLNGLSGQLVTWLNRSDLTLVDDNAKPPVLISTENRKAMERTYEIDDMPLITIYANGQFESERKLAELSNRSVSMLYPKQIARIKLLLALGELSPAHIRALLDGQSDKDKPLYKELEELAQHPERSVLSNAAKSVAKEFDDLYRRDQWDYVIQKDKEDEFEQVLYELCQKGLVMIIDNKVLLGWRLHTARWSNRFWTRRFKITCEASDRSAHDIMERVGATMTKDLSGYNEEKLVELVNAPDPRMAEQALRAIRKLDSMGQATQDVVINALSQTVFVDAAAIDVIVDHRQLFEAKVREAVRESIRSQELAGYFNKKQKKLHHLINILFKWAVIDPVSADDITLFVYDAVVHENRIVCKTVPSMILQCVIENLGEVYHDLHDDTLKDMVHHFIFRSSFSYIYRTKLKARRALKTMGTYEQDYSPPSKDINDVKSDTAVDQENSDRRLVLASIEQKRKDGNPIHCVISDFDDTLLNSFTKGLKCLDPALSFWLNWLTEHDMPVVLATGSGYERLYDRCFSARVALPLQKNKNLHLFTDAGSYYNDRLIPYKGIPDELWGYVDEVLLKKGWVEFNDGRLPRKAFVNTDIDEKSAFDEARALKSYLAMKGYDYDMVVSRWAGSKKSWLIKIYAVNKISGISRYLGISETSERTLALFDDAGEFGVDRAFMDFARNGIRVNVGHPLDDENGLLQLGTKNEYGARLAIEALVASMIIQMITKEHDFRWNELVNALKHTGVFSSDAIDEIVTPVRELVEEGLSSIEDQEELLLKDLLLRSKNAIQATPVHFIEIHPTNRCNLDCDNCIAGNREKASSLPYEDIDHVGAMNPSEVLIIGGGEPTLYRDGVRTFNDFVLRLRELRPQAKLYLGTNGVFIPSGKWQEAISWVSISLHGSSRETFKKRTGKDKFEVVWNNIFNEYLLNGPIKDIRISFVYTKDNFHEIFPLVEKIWQEWRRVKPELDARKIEKKLSFVLQAEAEDKGPHEPFAILDLTDDMKRYWENELNRIESANPELWDFIKEHANHLLSKPFQKQIAKPAEICWVVSNYLLVGANGMISPCCVMPASAPQTNLGSIGQPLDSLLRKRKAFMAHPPLRCKKGCHICRSYTGYTVKKLLMQRFESGDIEYDKNVPSAEAIDDGVGIDQALDIIEIYPTDICMLGCKGCTNVIRHLKDPQIKVLPIETLDKLKEFKPKQIRIIGGGEPTLYKYKGASLNEFIARIRGNLPEARIGMATNGIYIPDGDWQKELAWVGISLYGATREDFLKYTGDDKFDTVLDNIFHGYFTRGPIKDVRVTFFYSKENIQLVPALIQQLWERWKVAVHEDPALINKKRFLINLAPYSDDTNPENSFGFSNLNDAELSEYSRNLRIIQADQPELWRFIKTYAPSVISRPYENHVSPATQKCPMATKLALLAADQHLYPCFAMANTVHGHDYGPINELSPERLLEIRKHHYNDPPEMCRQSCHPGATYTGKMVKKANGDVSFGYANGMGVADSTGFDGNKTEGINVAITGATGDIGVGLTKLILNKGGKVTSLGRRDLSSDARTAFMADNKGFSYEKGNIFSKQVLKGMLNKNDVIYHLAAIVGQDLDPEMQASVLAVNAFGTGYLAWLAARTKSFPTIVYGSSQRCYKIENDPIAVEWMRKALDQFLKERDRIFSLPEDALEQAIMALSERILKEYPLPAGIAIYDISKLMGEELLQGLPNVVIARIANVYGPGCSSGRLIQRLVQQRFENGVIRVEDEMRDNIYTDDVSAILYALGKGQDAGLKYLDVQPKVVDIASGTRIATQDIWEIIKGFTPEQQGQIELVSSRKSSAIQDGRHAEQLLGRSFCSIQTGIRNVIDTYKYRRQEASSIESGTIVFDIGGTSIRTGIFYPDGVLEIISKEEAPNYKMYPDANIDELQQKLIEFIKMKVEEARSMVVDNDRTIALDKIAVSFPGPVVDYSIIDRAATLWGTKTKSLDLPDMLKKYVRGVKDVRVIHDISADAVRYAVEKKKDKFCIVTVSSGISCRIYDKQKGGLITDELDLAGEIGHLKVDYSKEAPLCECGERGHLNALASGRAAERIVRERAVSDPEGFKRSLLYEYALGNIANINNSVFADAVAEGDEWALGILQELAEPVAHAINQVSTVSGIRDFYVVGGFAIANGDAYLEALLEHLRTIRLLNREQNHFDGHIALGYSDDADGMRGAGYFVQDLNSTRIEKTPLNIVDPGHVSKSVDREGYTYIEALAPSEIMYRNYFTGNVFDKGNLVLAQLCHGRKSLMVIDDDVYVRWKDSIDKYIWDNKLDCTVLSLPGGEICKDIDYTEVICNRASELALDRKGIIIAVGGGAIMDVAGLSAQLYRRGVDYIRVPTTLLGMIDAAVGVKVGINYKGSKNFLGAFYPPKYVITDTEFLTTLPEREMRSGIAEIIKVALISNRALFEVLESDGDNLVQNIKFAGYDRFIEDAAVELLKHLQMDFYEHDLMRHVDFGHTMAHYFESVTNYQMTHGEAVGIDILISAYVAKERGILSLEDFNRIVELHKKIGLPFYHPAIHLETMWSGVQKAISHKGGHLMMVVPREVGRTAFIDSLSKDELAAALTFLKSMDHEKSLLIGKAPIMRQEDADSHSAINIPFEKIVNCFSQSQDKFPEGVLESVMDILEKESQGVMSISDIKRKYPDSEGNAKKRIVLTGGVYGGKTTFLRRIAAETKDEIVCLPEVVPSLIEGGIKVNPDSYIEQVYVQRLIYILKYLFEVQTSLMYPEKTILCERGTLDGIAWWPGRTIEFENEFGGVESELERYRHVIFVESVASTDHAKDQLKKRYENVKQARAIDQTLNKVWRHHDSFYMVYHEDWDRKTTELDNLVAFLYEMIIDETALSRADTSGIATASNLLFELLRPQFKGHRIFTIRYDGSRLSEGQIAMLKEYVNVLNNRMEYEIMPSKIMVQGRSGANASGEPLMEVDCKNEYFNGKGYVNVSWGEGRLEDYRLRITDIVNMAIVASNIPDDHSRWNSFDHEPLVRYIQERYNLIMNRVMAVSNVQDEYVNDIKRIVLDLPMSMHLSREPLRGNDYFSESFLTAA